MSSELFSYVSLLTVKAEAVSENKEMENFCGGINISLTFLNTRVEPTVLTTIYGLLNNCKMH
jgi:hypothetical protein